MTIPLTFHSRIINMTTIKAATSSGIYEIGKLSQTSTTVLMPEISDNQVLVKSVAFAANPVDWKHVYYFKKPAGNILGSDVSGIVDRIGSNVTHVRAGNKVAGTLVGNESPQHGAFSQYVAVDENAVIKLDLPQFSSDPLPVSSNNSSPIASFEGGASLPMSLATVAVSFSHNFKPKKDASETILIWGGATSAGVMALQVAKLVFGMKVFVTASKKQHAWLKSLGADATFDYHDNDVVEQIVSAANGCINYGYDTVATPQTFQQLYDATKGSKLVKLDNLLFLTEKDIRIDPNRNVGFFITFMYSIFGGHHTVGDHEFSPDPELVADYNKFWYDTLPQYLPYIKTTNLRVLPPGFESVDTAFQLLHDNKVAGEKVVFRYD